MLRLKTLAVLAPAFLVSLALSPTRAAAADNYGAIAFSQDSGKVGWAYDYRSRSAAEERALEECGNDCEVVLWIMNACGALATGDDNGYGTGWAGSRARAEEIAKANCEEHADNCRINRWICTSR
jgi:serine/threonine-protein kinase